MSGGLRWDPCIRHTGSEAEKFIASFFGDKKRNIFLVAGAGFDPRSATIARALAACHANVRAVFIREERPNPELELVTFANKNTNELTQLIPASHVELVRIFANDGAVVGGHEIVRRIQAASLNSFTDLAVDMSSLSTGIAFPVVRFLMDQVQSGLKDKNVHLFVISQPDADVLIVPTASDRVGTMRGFQGGLGLDEHREASKLWLPQLMRGKRTLLDRIRAYVDPDDICPILPFPATNPRLPDELITHYDEEFTSSWDMDERSIVYADETNPLDLYRTILRIDALRRTVFEAVGGSLTVLSPLGSKALAIGALMAAIERNLPVVYVEAIAYTVDFSQLNALASNGELSHVWLHGEAYPHNEDQAV